MTTGLAPEWIVEVIPVKGGRHDGDWQFLYQAKCMQITYNPGAEPCKARIELNGTRWNETGNMIVGDRVRVREGLAEPSDSTLLFDGILTQWVPFFNEQNEVAQFNASCFKHVVANSNQIFGQRIRPQSLYVINGDDKTFPDPIEHRDVAEPLHAWGRRCVFNAQGLPNKDTHLFKWVRDSEDYHCPLFGYVHREHWKARDMIAYVLNTENKSLDHNMGDVSSVYNSDGDTEIIGLTDKAFDEVIHDVQIEGLNPMEALEYICSLVNRMYRLDIYMDGSSTGFRHVFYEPGNAVARNRGDSDPIVLHTLISPDDYRSAMDDDLPVIETTLSGRLANNENLIQGAQLNVSTAHVVNSSEVFGETSRYEITAELVPAWLNDAQTKGAEIKYGLEHSWIDNDNEQPMFLTNEELQDKLTEGEELNDFIYFSKFHPMGLEFDKYRDVGRKWALNETGEYSGASGNKDKWGYERGMPFKFESVIPDVEVRQRPSDLPAATNVGFFPRSVLPLHSVIGEGVSSGRYLLEISFDSGANWHSLNGQGFQVLEDEWGIYFTEPNLAEIKFEGKNDLEGTYDGADFTGITVPNNVPINYWSAIIKEKAENNTFYPAWDDTENEWAVRLRLTACIELDHRVKSGIHQVETSGVGIEQVRNFDLSDRIPSRIRTESSIFDKRKYDLQWGRYMEPVESPDAHKLEPFDTLVKMHEGVDRHNRQASISGSFTLPLINLAENQGDWYMPRFQLGDCIDEIGGRGIDMSTTITTERGEQIRYAAIHQIVFHPEVAQTTLVTADLRTSQFR